MWWNSEDAGFGAQGCGTTEIQKWETANWAMKQPLHTLAMGASLCVQGTAAWMKVISRGVRPCLSWCGFGEEHRTRCFPTITSKAVLGMPWSRRMAVRRFKCKQPLCPGRVRQCLMRVCPVRTCQSRNLENWPPVVRSTGPADTKSHTGVLDNPFHPLPVHWLSQHWDAALSQ